MVVPLHQVLWRPGAPRHHSAVRVLHTQDSLHAAQESHYDPGRQLRV